MLTGQTYFSLNTGFRFKIYRVSRGMTLPEAEDLTGGMEGNNISRAESGAWLGEVETYYRILESYCLHPHLIFNLYTTAPDLELKKLVDHLATTLGHYMRTKRYGDIEDRRKAFLTDHAAEINRLLQAIGAEPLKTNEQAVRKEVKLWAKKEPRKTLKK